MPKKKITNARREEMLRATEELRLRLITAQNKLAELKEEDSICTYPCARKTRLGDRIWDETAKIKMYERLIDEKVNYILTCKTRVES